MPVIVGVALGGALGASARYGLDRLIERSSSAVFPVSTFVINVSGCFLIGVVSAALVDRHHLPGVAAHRARRRRDRRLHDVLDVRTEALDLGEFHHLAVAAAYVVASVAVGLAAVYAGGRLGQVL